MIAEAVAAVLLVLGALFTLLAAAGALRMPDCYSRLSTVSKATPVGVGLLLLGAAVQGGDAHSWTQSLLTLLFVAATTPVAAQRLARAADRAGAPFDARTLVDPAAAERPTPADEAGPPG